MAIAEVDEAPECAQTCFNETFVYSLPPTALYLGMGSSYFAAVTAKAAGAILIQPEIAWEYYTYCSGACLCNESKIEEVRNC